MFRPYNLTSLAAWTAVCLAGNAAYCRTKGNRAKGSDVPSGSIITRAVPESVRLLQTRLQTPSDQVNRLLAKIGEKLDAGHNKLELTAVIHLLA